MEIILRADATARGLLHYFTGTPCLRGHISKRRTRCGSCVACANIWAKGKAAKILAIRSENRLVRLPSTSDSVTPLPSTRALAVLSGDVHYLTSKPCKNGHISKRLTGSGKCLVCSHESSRQEHRLAKASATRKLHYIETRVEKLAYGKEYRKDNREKFTKWMAEWRQKNPERARELRRASEAKRRAKGGGMPSGEMRAWVMAAPKVCHWCGIKCPKKYHVDHYEPLSKGGKHVVANLVIACPKCNLKKSAKDPYEFAATVGRLF